MGNDREVSASLIEEIKKVGITAPDNLTEKELQECLSFAREGASQSDIDKMYKTKAPVKQKAPPPAKAEQMKTISMTEDELTAMMDRVAQRAIAEHGNKAVAAPSVIYVDGQKKEKPRTYDTKQVDKEDFLKTPFIVFHMGFMHSEDRFKVDGREVEPPYSKLILFNRYEGPETQRFGPSENIVTLCCYKTQSEKEKAMFLADVRWGVDFWSSTRTIESDDVLLQNIITRIHRSLEGYDHAAIKKMANSMDVPVTTLANMRTEIALKSAKIEFARQKAESKSEQAEKEKVAMLTT